MIVLENKLLKITIAKKGAELQSVQSNGLEYIWEGDPAFWGKHSPVLFPIVGGLKNNAYTYKSKQYSLGRHGFARDKVFTVLQKTATSVQLGISDTEETLAVYPFAFQFFVTYTLDGDVLKIQYSIKNTGDDVLYYSVGAHPAFRVPLAEGLSFEDYYLQFGEKETAGIYPLDTQGQIELEPVPFLEKTDHLALKKSLFYKDALVFKGLKSNTIAIQSEKSKHGLRVSFDGFPYMGIWSAKDADFVCIEPWNGIADNVAATGDLQKKEGIRVLEAAKVEKFQWSVQFF